MQTVVITSKDGLKTVGLSICPVAPYETYFKKARAVTKLDATVFWYNDKTIKFCSDGSKHTWFKKPTLMDAVESRGSGYYYEFNSDGSVNAKIDGIDFMWSSCSSSDTPEPGQCVAVHVCHNAGGEYFLESEKCPCGACLYCDKRCVNDTFFCSSACEMSLRE
jgi:hypothetical protein